MVLPQPVLLRCVLMEGLEGEERVYFFFFKKIKIADIIKMIFRKLN